VTESTSTGLSDSHSAGESKKKKGTEVAEKTRVNTPYSSGSARKRMLAEIKRLKLEVEKVRNTSDRPESSESMEKRVTELLGVKLKELREENRISMDLLDDQEREFERSGAVPEEL